MKDLLITHTDLDGISPIILLNLVGINYDYYSIDISDVDETFNNLFSSDLSKYKTIYIVDLTIPENIYEELNNRKLNVLVFDHHETHLYATKYPFATVMIDLNNRQTCGTELFYNFLTKEYPDLKRSNVQEYVDFVRELDTYNFTSDIPKQLESLRKMLGRVDFIKTITKRLKKDKVHFEFTAFEKRYFKISQTERDRYVHAKEQEMLRYKIKNHVCGIVFAENHKSEIGNYLSQKYPELEFIVIYDTTKGISYRTSRDDVYVSKFAENFGGGHQKASGSPFTKEHCKQIIETYFGDVECLDE